ncbi:hypothetical protein H7I77_05455 [Mycolicibacterium novocastrense]|uniref:TrbL/VirB6 plasmid conjugal transfer protein n=1 Tax=Mycolicibacterium novocastrense TaxID=59813 RepID=A0AAW5SF29_MYCNV|nr:hypothetical protein [Mycolicibacterium novocastrense]MCV7022799.1 hypothetical protein [Mycolicibacterium novocastrense]GAT10373.1 uncharacterized protein RMCN_3506 [Mycolicibacterium novocastrense]
MLAAAFFRPGWDPTLPTLGQLFARGWALSNATRLRRFTMLPIYLQLCLCLVALIFPAEAHAAIGPQSPLLYVLGVTDSYGVPLSRYAISTDYGSVLDGGSQAVLATLLEAEAGLFVVIGGVAIWFLMYVISFGFLPDLVQPVASVVQDYAGQILPGVAAIAAIVAATFVAVNILRGNLPRAASQGAAAVLIALIGGALVYSPISWVISDSGPLAQGRDVAVSLGSNSVAGLDNTSDTLNRLEGTLATSFVRRPLQTWNFAGQPDSTPSCAAAWSEGVRSGDPDNIKDGIRACGASDSAAMKATADNPSPGQLGTGVLMLMFIGIFALFCAVLGFHIVLEFFRAVANAFKLLWGFAVGVIPGGPQASLVNTFVAMLFSGVAMFGYITMTIFIGEIVTVVFRQQGNGVVAMMSALILMMVAIRLVFAMSKSLKKSSANVASGVISSVGAAPPPPTTNILQEKAGGFLRDSSVVAMGLGATMAGGALAARSPSASHALHVVAPFVRGGRSSMVRHLDRGADIYENKKAAEAAAAERAAREAEKEQKKAAKQGSAPPTASTATAPPATAASTPSNAAPAATGNGGGPAPAPQSGSAPATTQFSAAPDSGDVASSQATPLTANDLQPPAPSAPPSAPSPGYSPPGGNPAGSGPHDGPPPAPRTGSAAPLPDWGNGSTSGDDTSPPSGPAPGPAGADAAPPSPFEPPAHPAPPPAPPVTPPATGSTRPLPPPPGPRHSDEGDAP